MFILSFLFGDASRKTILVTLHKIDFLRSLTRPLLIPVFLWADQKQKTPPKRGFYQGFAVGRRRTHCVTSTQKVYAIEDERAIPARILTFLSMNHPSIFVQKTLFIYTVFIYTEGVRSERGGRSSTGATKSWLKRVVPSVP
ncbi:hypothetical protein ACJBF7_19675 [Enterobacter sp. 04-C-01-SI_S15]|uniref:Uncharacterized protein n=1 Tax=Enterobacter rongchengensis TaxID=3030999 RepID=A0ABV4JCI6_9ENTR|nr:MULTISPECIES: hypothetical protein [Enterobacter]HCR0840551.1 hypothetical protein [Enterobacter cancerogenus]ELV3045872.1 hypothetical protein [Enterobacter chengduensis]MCK7282085.1 hypothetical protein [Enterobacter chengduensis]MCM7424974.1 hypothetical protein [Enterobacter chengduensis]MDL0066557.1 hypothetical protein [Enterobacter chengduensis]